MRLVSVLAAEKDVGDALESHRNWRSKRRRSMLICFHGQPRL